MHVLVFGDSGVGKSSNIVASYASLKDRIFSRGLFHRCRITIEPDDEIEKWYRDYWRHGQYPNPTVRNCDHQITVSYRFLL